VDTESIALAVVRPLGYAALVALTFVPLERLAPLRPPTRREHGVDIGFATLGGIASEILVLGVSGLMLALAETIGDGGPLASWPDVPRVALSLVLLELGGYAYHRAAHAWGPLWALHRVHHGSTSMDWLAGLRQHPLEIALMTAAQNLPLVLLGLPLGAHALLVLALRVHTVFVHANLRTPRALGLVIACPPFHHRHHDRDAPVANFASLLPFVDRVLGTFDPGDAQVFGVRSSDDARRPGPRSARPLLGSTHDAARGDTGGAPLLLEPGADADPRPAPLPALVARLRRAAGLRDARVPARRARA
jgi:sterol desaturase/sphingolipid hydroxylase (fatty acid hydroxylase superfamily)